MCGGEGGHILFKRISGGGGVEDIGTHMRFERISLESRVSTMPGQVLSLKNLGVVAENSKPGGKKEKEEGEGARR